MSAQAERSGTGTATINRKEAAVSFLRLAASGKVREAYDAHIDPNLRHHNPFFAQGAGSLSAAQAEAHEKDPNETFEIQRALEDGELVAVHSRVKKARGQEYAVVHIFRFDGAKVVELWDVIQEVPADSPNENGMF